MTDRPASGPDGGRTPRRRPQLTEEDLRLWQQVAATAQPLQPRPRRPAAPPPAEPEPPAGPPPLARVGPPAPPHRHPAPRRPVTLPELKHGTAAGLDKSTLTRLRRGRLPIEARLDLHGMTEATARSRLDAFLAGQQAFGRRAVLVITGKGVDPDTRRTDERSGVLRRSVPRWLNEAPNRARVLAFCHAQPRDGGAGALYVLLRRNRDEPGNRGESGNRGEFGR